MTDLRDMASNFEAIKIAMTQTKDGHVLKLVIQPTDTPEEIMRDPVGQRYMVAVVRVDDNEKPIPAKSQADGLHAIKLAATLCNNRTFQQWLFDIDLADAISSEAADTGLKRYLEITSKRELKTDRAARDGLYEIRERYRSYLKETEGIRRR